MANVYYNTGQLEQAHRYFTELIKLDKASNDKGALSVSLFNLGHVNASRKLFSKANKNFKASLKLSRELADDAGIASALKAMDVNVQAQSKNNTTKKYLREPLQLFVAIHDKTEAPRVQRHLCDITDEQALEHHQRYTSLQKQLLEQQNKEVTQRLQSQFETQHFASETNNSP